MEINKIRFSMPSIISKLIKQLGAKKCSSLLKSKIIDLLQIIILSSMNDNNSEITQILNKMENEKKESIIFDIKNIGQKQINENLPKNTENSELKSEKFNINIDKNWLIQTSKKLNSAIKKILEFSKANFDFSHSNLKKCVLNFGITILLNCSKSMRKSCINLLKLIFISYFSDSDQNISELLLKMPKNIINVKSEIELEFKNCLFDISKIIKEVDSQKQRTNLMVCIGFSWICNKFLNSDLMFSETDLMRIYDSLLKILELNSKNDLITEISNSGEENYKIIDKNVNNFEYMSFLRKNKNNNLMKYFKLFSLNSALWLDFTNLSTNLPNSLKISLFNYIFEQISMISDEISKNDNQMLKLGQNMLLACIISQNCSEIQNKFLGFLIEFIQQNNTAKINEFTKNFMNFIINYCINDIVQNSEIITKMLKPQKQNQLILILFEFLANQNQAIKLLSEFSYLNLCKIIEENEKIENIIEIRYPALIDLLMQKLNFFYFENKTESSLHIISSLIEKTPILFSKSIENILKTLIRCFDKYYTEEFLWVIEHFMPIFIKVLKYCKKSENNKILTTNTIRQILMRIKPLLGSTKNTLVVAGFMILKESFSILENREMEREESGNFSQEDPDNVTIPNSLTAIFYEFWPEICYQFNMGINENLVIISECMKVCEKIVNLAPEYFVTEDRFEIKLWPKIKKIMKKHISNHLFLTKTQISAISLINSLFQSQKLSEKLVCEILETVYSMLEPKVTDKEIILTAYGERLVQLSENSAKIFCEASKNKYKNLIVEFIKTKIKPEFSVYEIKKNEKLTLWAICMNFVKIITKLN